MKNSPRISANERKAITEFVARLHHRFGDRIQFVKLFGSKARGDAEPLSDIDLFILIDQINSEERREIIEFEVDVDLKYDVVLSSIIYTLAKYEDPKRRVTPFFQNVMREGIAV